MIRNKDGSKYELTKPNPITKGQFDWINEKIIFHNMVGKIDVFPDLEEYAEIKQTITVGSEESELEEGPAASTEPIPFLGSNPPKIEQSAMPESPRVKQKNVLLMYCLPATIKENENGDRTIQYGEKFTFECLVVSRGDLQMVFWCNT